MDEDENTTFVPVEPAASVLASGSSSTADDPGPNTKLPRHQTGQVSIFSTYVGLFSSHANELRKAHQHLSTERARELPQATSRRKRTTQPRLSDEKIGQIVSAYETGKTVYELAAEYGCHRVTISAILKRRGVALRRMPPSDEQVTEMIRLYETGLSLTQVGEHLGFSATTVLHRIRAAGRTTRNSTQR
ncbi:hypothetical protein GCM10027064_21560 [Microbacterium petrolearium]